MHNYGELYNFILREGSFEALNLVQAVSVGAGVLLLVQL